MFKFHIFFKGRACLPLLATWLQTWVRPPHPCTASAPRSSTHSNSSTTAPGRVQVTSHRTRGMRQASSKIVTALFSPVNCTWSLIRKRQMQIVGRLNRHKGSWLPMNFSDHALVWRRNLQGCLFLLLFPVVTDFGPVLPQNRKMCLNYRIFDGRRDLKKK